MIDVPTDSSVLQPAFVLALRDGFVLVDRVQPVAAAVSFDGHHLGVASWSSDGGTLPAWSWPGRHVTVLSDTEIAVRDSAGTTAALSLRGAELAVDRAVDLGRSARWMSRPMWVGKQRIADEGLDLRTSLSGTRWTSTVSLSYSGEIWAQRADCSVLGAATGAGRDKTLVCFQLCNKRPWSFSPATRLTLFERESGLIHEIDAIKYPARFRWPSTDYDQVETSGALAEYLRYTIGTLDEAASGADCRNAVIEVVGSMRSREIIVEFSHRDFPGVRFRRSDRPFDECGRRGGGLREMNVSLAEDLAGGLLDELYERAVERGEPVATINI